MEAGIASIVAVQADETQVEVGLVGPEGMTGTAVVLGGDQSPHSTYIQVAGEAQWIKADELRKAMRTSDLLRALLLKYVQIFMVQTTHTAIANARAHIDRRLARWILMAHDRTGDKTLPLTHEFLALMLGVRRPGVTEALQSLKQQKLIDTGRNQIVVLNRNGIEKLAGIPTGCPKRNIGGSLVESDQCCPASTLLLLLRNIAALLHVKRHAPPAETATKNDCALSGSGLTRRLTRPGRSLNFCGLWW